MFEFYTVIGCFFSVLLALQGEASPVSTPVEPAMTPAVPMPSSTSPPDPSRVVPDLGDRKANRPVAGVLRLSQQAIDSRMRRVFTPNVKGEFKVSAEIVQQWKSKRKGRKSLQQLFQSCGFDTDWQGFKTKTLVFFVGKLSQIIPISNCFLC